MLFALLIATFSAILPVYQGIMSSSKTSVPSMRNTTSFDKRPQVNIQRSLSHESAHNTGAASVFA